ncbi:MAG: hypothetical protein Q9192_008439, partial [Flavoplaca navasiana]
CIVPVKKNDSDTENLVNSGRIKSDGKRLIESPSARAYTPSGLAPFSPIPGSPTPHARSVSESELFDGRLESTELIELLHASGQKRLRFEIFRDIETRSGLSIHSFRTGGSLNMDAFTTLASNLKVLCLTLESCSRDPVERKSRLFTHFLQEATRLEVLVLELPWVPNVEFYGLNDIFDPIEAWIRPTLTKLILDHVSGSYHDLSRLLFFNLQSLKHLHFSDIMLLDGCWEDVIEGLRQIVPLRCCAFSFGL